jgi:glutathione peroxidase
MNFYDFIVKDSSGNDVSLSNYKGKLLLIVNTATGCGFTPQYQGLQALYEKYQSKGLEILDFPCNQFANQAPGTESEIQDFCTLKYNTTFKLFAKVKVNGKDAEPMFDYLKKEKGGALGNRIKWNFTKFLVDPSGKVLKRYAPTDTPENIEKDIQQLLCIK